MTWTVNEPNSTDNVDYPVDITGGGTTGLISATATYTPDYDASGKLPAFYPGFPKAFVCQAPPPNLSSPPPGAVAGVPGQGGNNNCFLFTDVPLADTANDPNTVYIWDQTGALVASQIFYCGDGSWSDLEGEGGKGPRVMNNYSRWRCRGSDALTIPTQVWALHVRKLYALLYLERLDLPWNPPGHDHKRLCMWKNKLQSPGGGGLIHDIKLQCESPCPKLFTLTLHGQPAAKYTLKAKNFGFHCPNTLWQKVDADGKPEVDNGLPCLTIYPA